MSETIEQKCLSKGVKLTDQRRIIAKVMSESTDHPDVDELYGRVSKIDPKISIATVYRTVKLFEESGILTKHEFKGGKARYEELNEGHHDHLIDIKTGEIIEFVDNEIEKLQKKVAEKYGYKLVDHKLELYGVKKTQKMSKKIFIKTFGCQMNEYDSNRIFDAVKKIGFTKTQNLEDANCYLLNTCHIRDKAKDKVYHEIGRVKKNFRQKKKPLVIVAGCVAQAENEEMLKREPYIDIVIGPQAYHKINSKIEEYLDKQKKLDETEFDAVSKFNYLDKLKNSSSKISSFLTIQEGCDKFCNFCVVPYTRGPEYSRPFIEIINEAKVLSENGVKEIILLGQNVNAYNNENFKLSDLILEIEKIPAIKRIRYTTSHPKDMTEDLLNVYSISKKLMPLVHLPVKSGSDKILKLMNRKHLIKDYLDTYEKLKNINPKIQFSSDFIISYPGENDEDFNATLDLIKNIKFINSYSFMFSPRPGTTASNLSLIDKKISSKRLEIVQRHLFNNQIDMNQSLIGNEIEVLVENKTAKSIKYFGRSEYMTPVIFDGKDQDVGKVIKVKINNSNQNTLFGENLNNLKQRVA